MAALAAGFLARPAVAARFGRAVRNPSPFASHQGTAAPYAVGGQIMLDGIYTGIFVEDGNKIPLNALIEAIGGTVSWCNDTRQIIISHHNEIKLRPNIRNATINGRSATLSSPLRIENDHSMVTLCFITRYMELGLGFIGDTVIVTSTAATGVPVLMYHHILPRERNLAMPDNPWVISTENFSEQMRYLQVNGFYPVTICDMENFLFHGRNLPANSVMIQFDDGYYSNFVYAAPIMRQFGMRGQIFFITSIIEALGEEQPPLDYNCLTFSAAHTIAAGRDVFESASHSHDLHDTVYGTTETRLVQAMRERVIEDTVRSFDFVENHRAFVFPQSQHNEYIRNALQDAGITMAFADGNAVVTRYSDPMALPRFAVYNSTTLEEFRNIVNKE